MIKVTCARFCSKLSGRCNKKLKGQFTRTFNDLYELSDWLVKATPWKVVLVKPNEELTKEQLDWLVYRHRVYYSR